MSEHVVGINSVEARLAAGANGIRRLRVREGKRSARLDELVRLADASGIAVVPVSDADLDALTSVNHQGVALEVDPPAVRNEDFLDTLFHDGAGELLFLVLDGVTDPRNLGACLRSAATMGVAAVIVPRDNSAGLTDAALKTASGGAAIVPLVSVVNLSRCLERLKKLGVWVTGTVLDGERPIHEVSLTGHVAIVMGSEGRGLRHNTIKHCDFLARIPMAVDTLGFNVAVAAGICLYEAHRQRTGSA